MGFRSADDAAPSLLCAATEPAPTHRSAAAARTDKRFQWCRDRVERCIAFGVRNTSCKSCQHALAVSSAHLLHCGVFSGLPGAIHQPQAGPLTQVGRMPSHPKTISHQEDGRYSSGAWHCDAGSAAISSSLSAQSCCLQVALSTEA